MKLPAAAAAVTLLAVWAFVAGCPPPLPPTGSPGSPGIISCTTDAVKAHGLELLPQVNDCLVAPSSWEACLLGLIKPAVGITEDIVACMVQSAGRHAAAAAEANPKDDLSGIEAERARAFIKSRGYVFSP